MVNRIPTRMVWCSALLAFGLAACGGGGGGAASPLPAVVAAAPAKPLSIVVIGDSLAAGVMVPPSHNELVDPQRSWPGRLQAALGSSAIVTNLAIPGAQSQVMLDQEIPKVPPDADVIVIADGANDCAVGFTMPGWPNVMQGVDRLTAASIAAAPHAHLVYVTQRLWGANTAGFIPQVKNWNAHMRAVAATFNGRVLDEEYDPQWYIPDDYGYDFLHPTDSGAARIARLIQPLVTTPW